MSNSASQKMLDAVSAAKESAKRAEREYDRGASRLQAKASRNIDLYGGSAVSQVADIASESRKICDALYAAYQTLVKMIDEQCRPLLEQEPDYRAVREVRNLIKWLNDESEIENNFTASLNSRSLGGVASGRYIPLIENKMIQSFWASKCDSWPGRDEVERAEKQQKEEEEKRRKEKAEAESKAEADAYDRAFAEWKGEAVVIEKRRRTKLDEARSKVLRDRRAEVETKREKSIKSAEEEIKRCKQIKMQTEDELASFGVLKFSKKSAAKKTIEEMERRIAAAEATIIETNQTYQAEIAGLDEWVSKKCLQIKDDIDKRYPLPPRPRKPYIIKDITSLPPMIRAGETIRKETLESMIPGKWYKISELQESIPALCDLTNSRISSIIAPLVGDYLEKKQDGRATYYRLVE